LAERKTLGVRPFAGGDTIRAAIAAMTLVEAVYNRARIRLAPYALYTEPGGMFVDGVVVERDGAPPRELKLGRFKLSGLRELAASGDGFTPEPFFDGADPKYRGGTLVAAGGARGTG
jgi:hypothetical protein